MVGCEIKFAKCNGAFLIIIMWTETNVTTWTDLLQCAAQENVAEILKSLPFFLVWLLFEESQHVLGVLVLMDSQLLMKK